MCACVGCVFECGYISLFIYLYRSFFIFFYTFSYVSIQDIYYGPGFVQITNRTGEKLAVQTKTIPSLSFPITLPPFLLPAPSLSPPPSLSSPSLPVTGFWPRIGSVKAGRVRRPGQVIGMAKRSRNSHRFSTLGSRVPASLEKEVASLKISRLEVFGPKGILLHN